MDGACCDWWTGRVVTDGRGVLWLTDRACCDMLRIVGRTLELQASLTLHPARHTLATDRPRGWWLTDGACCDWRTGRVVTDGRGVLWLMDGACCDWRTGRVVTDGRGVLWLTDGACCDWRTGRVVTDGRGVLWLTDGACCDWRTGRVVTGLWIEGRTLELQASLTLHSARHTLSTDHVDGDWQTGRVVTDGRGVLWLTDRACCDRPMNWGANPGTTGLTNTTSSTSHACHRQTTWLVTDGRGVLWLTDRACCDRYMNWGAMWRPRKRCHALTNRISCYSRILARILSRRLFTRCEVKKNNLSAWVSRHLVNYRLPAGSCRYTSNIKATTRNEYGNNAIGYGWRCGKLEGCYTSGN